MPAPVLKGTILVVLALAAAWPGATPEAAASSCLVCGERVLADAIVAFLLFVLAGIVLSSASWRRAIAGVAATVGLLAAATALIPGVAVVVVVLAAALAGGLAGVQLGRLSRYWIHPSHYFGDRMATVAAVLAAGSLLLTGWLTEQELPEPPYRVEWGAARPDLVPFSGQVLVSGIQPLPLVPGPGARGEQIKDLLEQGSLMGVLAVAGAPRAGLAQILALYDRRDRVVALFGVDGTDLVYRESTRGSRIGLDNLDIRAYGVLADVPAGDTLQLGTGKTGSRRCFLVREELSCRYGITGDSGWRLLRAMNGAPRTVLAGLSALWLALLLFPVGYWARWHLATTLGAGFVTFAWLRLPEETSVLEVPTLELSGAAAGVAVGLVVRWLVRRARERRGPSSGEA